ncbi:DHHA1 domain [Arabidopsis thaliana x Arabidopsis arenosa]|nr:DHHA1 domain [Arabidopsis thaliana x Arabidopsis arenosa]
MDDTDADSLKSAAEHLISTLVDPVSVVLGSSPEKDKVSLVAAFSPGIVSLGVQVGKFIAPIAKLCGGGGGGKKARKSLKCLRESSGRSRGNSIRKARVKHNFKSELHVQREGRAQSLILDKTMFRFALLIERRPNGFGRITKHDRALTVLGYVTGVTDAVI